MAPLSVQFTNASSANAQAFNWQFPGGTPGSSTAQNPTLVYNTAGTYPVTLTVSNAAGTNTATQDISVVVNPAPTAAFSSTVTGATASFTNTSTNATTYSWNFGDNSTANTATPSHTYAADGSYTVTLTATNPRHPYFYAKRSGDHLAECRFYSQYHDGLRCADRSICRSIFQQYHRLELDFPGGTPGILDRSASNRHL